jgi:hypothetical protein
MIYNDYINSQDIIQVFCNYGIKRDCHATQGAARNDSTIHFSGLFKNAQVQGAQDLGREAYIRYVERHGLQRNGADGRFVKPSAFSGKESI